MQSYTCYAIIITTLPDGCHFVSFYYKLVFLILAQLLVIPRTDLPVSLYRPILQIHCRKSLSVTHTLPAIFQRVRRRRTPAKTEDEDQAFPRSLLFRLYSLAFPLPLRPLLLRPLHQLLPFSSLSRPLDSGNGVYPSIYIATYAYIGLHIYFC